MKGLQPFGILIILATSCNTAAVGHPGVLNSQPAQLDATLDHALVAPGDTVRFTIDVDHQADVQVEIDEPVGALGGLDIVEAGKDPPRQSGGRIYERRWYTLRAEREGTFAIAPIAVRYTDATGSGGTLHTPEVLVQVRPGASLDADANTTQLADIKPLQPVHEWSRGWLYAAAALAAVVFVAAAGWWWSRRRQPRQMPVIPAHEVAFAALDRLRRTNFADIEAVRRYYFAISEVLRTYVENRFHVNATDLTTEEILARLPAQVALQPAEQQILTRFLADTDEVKYAGRVAGGPEIAQVYELALSFVETTREKAAVSKPEHPQTAA